MSSELTELRRVADFARKLMGPLPECPLNAARADVLFWRRFDALGRAVTRLDSPRSSDSGKTAP